MPKLSMVKFVRQRAYLIYIYCSTAKSKGCQYADTHVASHVLLSLLCDIPT